MRTIATTALFLVMIAVGAAPAAQADHVRRAAHDERGPRALAGELERVTDDLFRDARRAAGRIDRAEAKALYAVECLEEAADDFFKHVRRRGFYGREAKQELRQVKRAYRQAVRRIDDFSREDRSRRDSFSHDRRSDRRGGKRALRRDFRRVDQLLAALEDRFEDQRRHVARRDGRRFRVAHH